ERQNAEAVKDQRRHGDIDQPVIEAAPVGADPQAARKRAIELVTQQADEADVSGAALEPCEGEDVADTRHHGGQRTLHGALRASAACFATSAARRRRRRYARCLQRAEQYMLPWRRRFPMVLLHLGPWHARSSL